jgi:hypothetical protein
LRRRTVKMFAEDETAVFTLEFPAVLNRGQ